MILVWVSVSIILIATVLAILWTVSFRKRRLLSSLRIEIENQGNVDSRYQLLAEDPLGGLTFKFYQNGEPLPGVMKSDGKSVSGFSPVTSAPARSSGKGERVGNAIGFTGALANVMIGAGSLMGSFGKPLVSAGNQLFQGTVTASKAQTVSANAVALGTGEDRSQYDYRTQQGSTDTSFSGVLWAETVALKPGNKLVLDLKVQASYFSSDMSRSIQLKSQPSEGNNPTEVKADSVILVRGGFWSHKVYPPLTIVGTSTLLLALIYWLVRIGVLH
jgi:hypothetical protein